MRYRKEIWEVGKKRVETCALQPPPRANCRFFDIIHRRSWIGLTRKNSWLPQNWPEASAIAVDEDKIWQAYEAAALEAGMTSTILF